MPENVDDVDNNYNKGSVMDSHGNLQGETFYQNYSHSQPLTSDSDVKE